MGRNSADDGRSWRGPGQGTWLWVAVAALTIAVAIGPAPVLVPVAMAGLAAVMAPIERLGAFYGYGATAADLVLRPRMVIRLLLFPLLPVTMYCRVELRGTTLTSKGHPFDRSPVHLSSSTRFRLAVAVWARWRKLVEILDPRTRSSSTGSSADRHRPPAG